MVTPGTPRKPGAYQRILIVITLEETAPSRAAVAAGVNLAAIHGAKVYFFAVLPVRATPASEFALPGPALGHALDQHSRDQAEQLFIEARACAEQAGVPCDVATGIGLDPAGCIVEAARKRRCDLIVLSTAGSNAVVRLLGPSAVPGVITQSTVPVLIVKPSRARRPAARRERSST